jgi:hypothetical protein
MSVTAGESAMRICPRLSRRQLSTPQPPAFQQRKAGWQQEHRQQRRTDRAADHRRGDARQRIAGRKTDRGGDRLLRVGDEAAEVATLDGDMDLRRRARIFALIIGSPRSTETLASVSRVSDCPAAVMIGNRRKSSTESRSSRGSRRLIG